MTQQSPYVQVGIITIHDIPVGSANLDIVPCATGHLIRTAKTIKIGADEVKRVEVRGSSQGVVCG